MAKRYKTRAEIEAQGEGYKQGVQDCLKLLAKWVFMSNKDARACRDEMFPLLAPKK